MDLQPRNFTVMSVIEDESTQTWLLLRDSQYYCEIETEKVIKTETTDQEDERLDEDKINPDMLREEMWIGARESVKSLNLEENDGDRNNKKLNNSQS